MNIKNLYKLSKHLETKGLVKEAEFLSSMLDEEEDMANMMDLDDSEEAVEFGEEDSEEEFPEDEDHMMEAEQEGEEFSFEGSKTVNFHCCPEAKSAMSSLCDMAGTEEEVDLCMEIMEEVDAFLGDKLSLMEGGGSKESLCEFMNKGLSAMYAIGQASGIMDEDFVSSFQFLADAVDEVCSDLLEE